MERLRARLIALRFMLAAAWPIVLITAIGLVVAYQFVAPEPPRRITISMPSAGKNDSDDMPGESPGSNPRASITCMRSGTMTKPMSKPMAKP